ncbi:SDR family NAD(P)-dependent oxidoreductase [Brachybacterium sp. DNPG3]
MTRTTGTTRRPPSPWTLSDVPDQSGRTHVITGATAGIGYFAAEQLAAAGARVVLAGRSPARLETAAAAIRSRVLGAVLDSVVVDLASRESVARATEELADPERFERIDGLLLNGGAMAGWTARSADGLPLTLATHVVASVGLIARLLPVLAAAGTPERPSRIVHTSTGFVDRAPGLARRDPLRPPRLGVAAYTQAKAITEVLALELDRRLRAADAPVVSILDRPGIGVDARTPERPGVHDASTPHRRNPFSLWAQGKDAAAWPAVRALTDPSARGGELFAPANGIAGAPVRIAPPARTAAPGAGAAEELWSRLAALAGVESPLSALPSGAPSDFPSGPSSGPSRTRPQ